MVYFVVVDFDVVFDEYYGFVGDDFMFIVDGDDVIIVV